MKGYYASPGSHVRSNASLNGEYVTIRNTTRRAIDLAGRRAEPRGRRRWPP
ncbi:hypothetical protein [Streptosporangium roseum]|uniref:hypothetical protein n=1 Tax=Streptosporangium roseum TaxID=2001 RepID=UPI0012DBEE8D|nr:hypothetical protein [Streptosporangium roseum]